MASHPRRPPDSWLGLAPISHPLSPNSHLSPLESAVLDKHRVLPVFSRNRLLTSPLECAVPRDPTCKSFRMRTSKKLGGTRLHAHLPSSVYTSKFRIPQALCLPLLRKHRGVWGYSSHSGTRRSSLASGGGVLLTDRLLPPGGRSHGFIHIAVDLFAGIALALIAALQVLKIILENFRARLAQAFSRSLVQCGFGLLLGHTIRVLTELHDSVVSAPIVPVLSLAFSGDLLLQCVHQEIVGSQNENEHPDPQNGELLEHGAEPIASPMFSLADYSLRHAARTKRHGRIITKFRLGKV